MSARPERRHRYAAIAVTLLALGSLAALAVAPFVRAKVAGDEIEVARATLAALTRLAERGPELADRNSAIRSERERLELLLGGDTTGIAGAELQRFLLNRTAHHKGAATTVLVQPPEREGGLTRISTLMTVRIGIAGLTDLLHDLETGLPLLFVSELSVRTLADGEQRGSGTQLDVRMRVSGFLPSREVPQS